MDGNAVEEKGGGAVVRGKKEQDRSVPRSVGKTVDKWTSEMYLLYTFLSVGSEATLYWLYLR